MHLSRRCLSTQHHNQQPDQIQGCALEVVERAKTESKAEVEANEEIDVNVEQYIACDVEYSRQSKLQR